jgi:hypothetical protein
VGGELDQVAGVSGDDLVVDPLRFGDDEGIDGVVAARCRQQRSGPCGHLL